MAMALQIIGKENFGDSIKKMRQEFTTANLRSALNYAIDPAYKTAKQLAPKGSKMHKTKKGRIMAPGFMARTMKKRTFQHRDKMGASATISLDPQAYYGQFVAGGYKRGKTNVPGRPFLRPAVDQNRAFFVSRFEERLRLIMKKRGLA